MLSLAMGPIIPLYGIVEPSPGLYACECGNSDCANAGKHPRPRYRNKATTDAAVIRQWLRDFTIANFAVVTGKDSIMIDADVLPDENGLMTLEYLQLDHGRRLPYTIEVITGRGNGSRHYYFTSPPNRTIRTRAKVLPGLDVRATGGIAVTPGSRHVCGGTFAADCRPDEQSLAELPDFLLEVLEDSADKSLILGAELASIASQDGSETLSGPYVPPAPDGDVLAAVFRDPVARFYWNGGRRNRSASEDDFALACKLAFYCGKYLPQMYRLFMASALRRSKFEEPRPGGNYALWTLRRAIEFTPAVWVRAKRHRPSTATGAKKGRKLSPVTAAIVDLHQTEPALSKKDIALRLGIRPKVVRDALYYHQRLRDGKCLSLIHSIPNAEVKQENNGSEQECEAA